MVEKSNPILGIADWLAQESRLDDAKRVLDSVHKSKKSTEDDKKAANQLAKSIKQKNREAVAKAVKKFIVMKPTLKLLPHKEIESKMTIKASDFNRIKSDIEERGVQVPLVVDEKNNIICGITRWKACKELGIDEVPCFEGSWDLYQDVIEYAIKDNIVRRQLSEDERSALDTLLVRNRDITPIGRPPRKEGLTKRQAEALEKKVNKIISKPQKTTKKIVTNVIKKDYKWVVGHNHHEDDTFPGQVGSEVTQQLLLLKIKGYDIKVNITYEVKNVVSEEKS